MQTRLLLVVTGSRQSSVGQVEEILYIADHVELWLLTRLPSMWGMHWLIYSSCRMMYKTVSSAGPLGRWG